MRKGISMQALLKASAVLLVATSAQTQFTHSGCEDLKASDFRKTEVFARNPNHTSIDEPMQVGLHGLKGPDGKVASVDVYFVGRKGQVKHFNGAAKAMTDMGTISV